MKRIIVTQRVDVIDAYGERRDALDQRWIDLLLGINVLPVLVPNHLEYVRKLVNSDIVDGILLTGGNSLSRYGGDAPERDEVDFFLLKWALNKGIPVLGVCRGMQIIQDYFSITLDLVGNHVDIRHKLEVNPSSDYASLLEELSSVNSFHEMGANTSVNSLLISARSDDGVIMALEHMSKPLFGQMWHSEREGPPVSIELDIIKKVFNA